MTWGRHAFATLLAFCGLACNEPEAKSPEPASQESAPQNAAAEPSTAPAKPSAAKPLPKAKARKTRPQLWGPKTKSLRLTRSVVVRAEPDAEAKKLGVVARDTRVGWQSVRSGPGCDKRWVEIEPRGFVCEDNLEPNWREPRAVELPKLDRGSLVPGSFGKVVAEDAKIYQLSGDAGARTIKSERAIEGSVTVRKYKSDVIDEEEFWHVGNGDWVKVSDLRIHRPSDWQGYRLGDETGLSLPLTLAVSKKNPAHRVDVFRSPGGPRVDRLNDRAVIEIQETKNNAKGKPAWNRIGEKRWIKEADTKRIDHAPPPPLTGEKERWFDINLSRQSIVAYEGEEPVYVTLISSGTNKHPTEPGIYRVWIKFAETDMNGQMAEEPAYSMATVPWTQFFYKDLALHTAYWHDKFGYKKSHGCINLSPIDSRFLYFWSDPQVPAGWSMAHGIFEAPGSMVRVRSRKDPNPPFRGYAKRVHEHRQSLAKASP